MNQAEATEPWCQRCGKDCAWATSNNISDTKIFYKCHCGSYYMYDKCSRILKQPVGDRVSAALLKEASDE